MKCLAPKTQRIQLAHKNPTYLATQLQSAKFGPQHERISCEKLNAQSRSLEIVRKAKFPQKINIQIPAFYSWISRSLPCLYAPSPPPKKPKLQISRGSQKSHLNTLFDSTPFLDLRLTVMNRGLFIPVT